MEEKKREFKELDKDLMGLKTDEVSVPSGLGKETFEILIKSEEEKDNRRISWMLGGVVGLNSITMVVMFFLMVSSILNNNYMWINILCFSTVINVGIGGLVIVFKDDILKKLNCLMRL